PARSPLFPYTTLFRSVAAAAALAVPLVMAQSAADKGKAGEAAQNAAVDKAQNEAEQKARRRAAAAAQEKAKGEQSAPREEEEERSEEHTSELQSRENL